MSHLTTSICTLSTVPLAMSVVVHAKAGTSAHDCPACPPTVGGRSGAGDQSSWHTLDYGEANLDVRRIWENR